MSPPSLHVLIVEDNLLNRILIREMLVHAGHTVAEAGNVEEGLERLRERVPDVVLADLQLPGRSGDSLLDEAKRRPAWAAIPMVAVTAFAMEGDRERTLALGFHGYFSKPLDTHTFVTEVENLVARHAHRR